jgi:hypothetical protein
VFHGLDAPTDVDSASNKQIIISRDGPKNRDSRKFNRINDLRKLIIEEIKDHQFSETESWAFEGGRNRSRRCGGRNFCSDRRDLGQGQQARKQRLTKPADRNDPLPL